MPEDWSKWSLDRRIDFWAQAAHGEITLTERDRICALEVWCEVFHGSAKDMKNADAREINAILSNLKDYKRANKPLRYGPYGVQRGYVKIGF